ncbi:hypothetical protein T439DRAFT_360811 [Meredithblackwellia eburnea MCA 4105]
MAPKKNNTRPLRKKVSALAPSKPKATSTSAEVNLPPCDRCKELRTKCRPSTQKGTCSWCAIQGLECVYTAGRLPKPRPPRKRSTKWKSISQPDSNIQDEHEYYGNLEQEQWKRFMETQYLSLQAGFGPLSSPSPSLIPRAGFGVPGWGTQVGRGGLRGGYEPYVYRLPLEDTVFPLDDEDDDLDVEDSQDSQQPSFFQPPFHFQPSPSFSEYSPQDHVLSPYLIPLTARDVPPPSGFDPALHAHSLEPPPAGGFPLHHNYGERKRTFSAPDTASWDDGPLQVGSTYISQAYRRPSLQFGGHGRSATWAGPSSALYLPRESASQYFEQDLNSPGEWNSRHSQHEKPSQSTEPVLQPFVYTAPGDRPSIVFVGSSGSELSGSPYAEYSPAPPDSEQNKSVVEVEYENAVRSATASSKPRKEGFVSTLDAFLNGMDRL